MNRLFLVAAVAALGVVVIGGTLFVAGGRPTTPVSSFVAPSAPASGESSAQASIAPTASPTPSTALDPIPAELAGRWMSSPRDGVADAAGVSLVFDADRWAVTRSNDNALLFASGQAGLDAGELVVGGGRAGDECATPGRYRWDQSPSRRSLVLAPVEDACATRAALLGGSYWRSACVDPGTNCLGDLDAGTYASQYVAPLASADAAWSPVYGALTYTVPDGWANWSDWPGRFGLTLSDAYASTSPDAIDPDRWILVLRDAQAASQAPACSGSAEPGAMTTPRSVLSALRTIPGLVVGKGTPVTIDGRQGVSADLTVDDAALVPCADGERAVEYLIGGDWPQAILPGERQRLILLDNGNGGVVAVQVHDGIASDFDTFAGAAMPIVETFRLIP